MRSVAFALTVVVQTVLVIGVGSQIMPDEATPAADTTSEQQMAEIIDDRDTSTDSVLERIPEQMRKVTEAMGG